MNLKKRTRKERSYDNNIPIYHHKWMMVSDDYHGFNVDEAKKRSEKIEEVIKKYSIDKKRIGYKTYWKEVVLPLLDK